MGIQKKPWYYQSWFLCLLFAFWPLILPAILGIIFLIMSLVQDSKREKNINEMTGKLKEYGDYESVKADFERDLSDLDQKIASLTDEKDKLQSDVTAATGALNYDEANQKLRDERKSIKSEIKEAQLKIEELEKEYFVGCVSIKAYDSLKSDEVRNELQMLGMQQDDMIKNGTAYVIAIGNRPAKYVETQKKQIMRCYNSETVNIIESVTVRNVDANRNKLQRTFENLNKLFDVDGVSISKAYHETKLKELSMVYAYMVKQEEEKELQREIREQLKEEEKVRREIEQEKVKIEKEKNQFSGEINKLMAYLQKASDIEKQLYIDKIRELEDKVKLLDKDMENVLEREQNTRAGFVYVISNIGSFGESVYKIGMTRRLEPMDRIKELSSASVPFSFDLHAMIFSEDAPALETILHQTFRDSQINKVNPRKEFFKIDLEAIKKIVKENHNATVQFVDIPEAIEYRESLRKVEAIA